MKSRGAFEASGQACWSFRYARLFALKYEPFSILASLFSANLSRLKAVVGMRSGVSFFVS